MINLYPNTSTAILSLVQGAKFAITNDDYSTIIWDDERQKPTAEEVQTELERLIQEYADKEYQRTRAREYPSVGDQLDALFHAGAFPTEMAALIQAVKDRYPKP